MRKSLILAFALAAAASLWAGETVDNGLNPKGESKTLSFVEDLKFGVDEDGDEFLWTHAGTSIAANEEGHIFIGDPQEARVLEFDANGAFVREAISKGQGPGELQGLIGFFILADGRAVCLDGAPGALPKLKFYDKGMNLIEEKTSPGFGMMPQTVVPSPDGKLFASVYVQVLMNEGKMNVVSGVINDAFEPVKTFTAAERPSPDFSRFGDPNYWVEFIGGNLKMIFKGSGVLNFGPNGALYSAVSNKYEITIWDADMKTPRMVIKKQYKPIPSQEADVMTTVETMRQSFASLPQLRDVVTESVLEKAVAYAEPPPVKNPLFGLIPMADGHVLAIHDVRMAERVDIADIFTPEGRYVGKAKMAGNGFMTPLSAVPRMSFRNGFAYTILTDEHGDNRAVRFRYRWIEGKRTNWE